MPDLVHKSTSTERRFAVSGGPHFKPNCDEEYVIDPAQVTVSFRNTTWVAMTIQGFKVWPDGSPAGYGALAQVCDRDDVPEWLLPLIDFNFEG